MTQAVQVFTLNENGLVPGPTAIQHLFLRDDGTWQVIPPSGAAIADAPVDGTWYGRQNGTWQRVLPEAPNDGFVYSRQSLAWVKAAVQSDAPADSTEYGRNNNAWTRVAIQSDAPSDSTPYVRQNAAWIHAPAFTSTTSGLVPSPGSSTGKVLTDAATWVDNSNPFTTTLNGMVPHPGSIAGKILSDSGTWVSNAAGGARFGTNVLDYGADPTGVADSVTAFENAMLASFQLASQAGKTYGRIKVPTGQYKFSRSCNLDICQTQSGAPFEVGYHFEGECQFVQTGQGSAIVGPSADYAFKSTMGRADGLNSNVYNSMIFENMYITGYGGIYIFEGSPTIRNCAFLCWRCIVVALAWSSCFENLVLRGGAFGQTQSNLRRLGQVGLFVYTTPNGVIRNIDASSFQYGTAIAVSGSALSIESLHCEVNRVAILLGFAPLADSPDFAGFDSLGAFTIKCAAFEGNICDLFIINANAGEIKQLTSQAHQDVFPDTAQTAIASIFINGNPTNIELMNSQTIGGFLNSAIVTRFGLDATIAYARFNNFANFFYLKPGTYASGQNQIKIFRGVSTQMPAWLVGGNVVKILGDSTQITAGTTVTTVASDGTLTLSANLVTSMTANSDLTGNFVKFTDLSNNQLGDAVESGYPFVTGGLAPF